MTKKNIINDKQRWFRNLLFVFLSLLSFDNIYAQNPLPTINPVAIFTNINGEEEESTQYSGSAPIIGRFTANPENEAGWSATYEWRFTLEGSMNPSEELNGKPYLTRYEQDTEYTFTKAGSHAIVLYAIFVQGKDTVYYTDEYWQDMQPIRVTISESRLDMPNAFSPNGDGINDVYKAKENWQSLVEFKATIYNRWGQKLYEWTDPSDGWDGTFHGQDVKQGVYYVNVEARGADGRKYHIRRDVNLLRGYTEEGNSSSNDY